MEMSLYSLIEKDEIGKLGQSLNEQLGEIPTIPHETAAVFSTTHVSLYELKTPVMVIRSYAQAI